MQKIISSISQKQLLEEKGDLEKEGFVCVEKGSYMTNKGLRRLFIVMNENKETRRFQFPIAIMYLIAGILLFVMLYDLQVGNIVPGVKGGGTLPHQAYILVLPALAHILYKCLRGESLLQK